jgi:hypothetical protein
MGVSTCPIRKTPTNKSKSSKTLAAADETENDGERKKIKLQLHWRHLTRGQMGAKALLL